MSRFSSERDKTSFIPLEDMIEVVEENLEKIYRITENNHSFEMEKAIRYCEDLLQLADKSQSRQKILYQMAFVYFVASSTRYISFGEFYTLLAEAVEGLRHSLLIDWSIVYFLPGDCTTRKSNFWVMMIVIDLLKPFFSDHPELMKKIVIPVTPLFSAQKNSEVVFFDDGIYSGKQTGDLFARNISILENTTVYILCPFRTEQGESSVVSRFDNPSTSVFFSIIGEQGKLVPLEELLPSWVLDHSDFLTGVGIYPFDFSLVLKGETPYYPFRKTVPVYFDHKLPDYLSCPDCFYKGTCPTGEWGLVVPLAGSLIRNCPSSSEEPRVNALRIDKEERIADEECPDPFYQKIRYFYRGREFYDSRSLFDILVDFKTAEINNRYRLLQAGVVVPHPYFLPQSHTRFSRNAVNNLL